MLPTKEDPDNFPFLKKPGSQPSLARKNNPISYIQHNPNAETTAAPAPKVNRLSTLLEIEQPIELEHVLKRTKLRRPQLKLLGHALKVLL